MNVLRHSPTRQGLEGQLIMAGLHYPVRIGTRPASALYFCLLAHVSSATARRREWPAVIPGGGSCFSYTAFQIQLKPQGYVPCCSATLALFRSEWDYPSPWKSLILWLSDPFDLGKSSLSKLNYHPSGDSILFVAYSLEKEVVSSRPIMYPAKEYQDHLMLQVSCGKDWHSAPLTALQSALYIVRHTERKTFV